MNKIYKLIWSQTANAFVAVSELASARGKSSSTTNNAASSADKKAGIFKPVKTALVLSMLFVLPHSVMAAGNVDANNLTVAGTSTFTGAATFNGGITANSITVGGKAVATSDQITNLETKKADKTAVDALDTKKADKTAVDALDTKKADKTTVDALSNRVTANETQLASLGLTNEYSGIKYFRVKSTEADAKAKATDSVAVGPKAYTETSATKGIAIGNAAQAGSKTSGEVTYDGAGSFMIGDGKSSLAIGDSAAARGNQNIAIGKSALTTNKDAAKQFSTNSIAIGTETKTIAASNAIALGNQAVVGAIGAVADSAIAIGDNAKALAADATAVGHLAQAGNFGLAAGTNAQATGQASVALGQNAQALPWRTISIGQDAGKNQAADKVGDKNEHINIGVQAGENIDGQLNISIGQKAGSDTKGKGNIALGQNAGQFTGGTNSSVGNNIAIGTNANKFASNTDVQETTAIGFGAKASGTRSVALGKETKSTAVDSVAIGASSQANGANSVAIGLNSIVNGADNVALGAKSVANTKAGNGYITGTPSSNVVSVGNDQLQRRIVNVADGADDQDAVTVAQLKRVSDEVYNKVNNQINGITAAAGGGINYDTLPRTTTENSITLSKDNKNTIIGNVAEGTLDTDAVNVKQLNQTVEANKTHYFSTKVNGNTQGNYNNNGAEGDISLAIGMDVRSTGDRSVTVGNRSTAESKGGIAIGALYEGSAALDDKVPQNAVQTVAKSSNGQPFEYNMAIGAGTTSEGNNSIAIGSLAKTSTKQQNNTSPDRAIAIGYFAAASDVKANAIGDRATSSALKANAFGSQAFSSGVSSTAIGTVAEAGGENSIAMGTHQRVTGANSGSIGYAGEFDPTNVGRDSKGTYAPNATQVSGTGTYSVGNTNSNVTSNESGIFGNDNVIRAKENVRVVGNKNTVTNQGPAANSPTAVTPTQDVYITGHNNQVDVAATPMENSKNLFIMGAANKVGTEGALTITDSYVIGTNNTINTSNTASASDDPSNPGTKVGKGYFILGNNVTATKENSVYLGTDAAYRAKGATTDGDAAVTEPVTVGGTLTYGGFAGKTPVGVVTVGDVGKERRIQNVAAGKIAATSTDAINGSQLYATNAKLGNVANTVKENFGGNATLNPDGSITYTNIGNTGKDNIHDAIKAATTKVEEGAGIKVDPTKNADGSTTYTVSAKTDGTTTKIDGNGNIAAVTTTFTPSTDGKVGAPVGNGDSLVTANTVANAINNSGWKATSGATGSGVVNGTTEELINPSETVTFQAGDNMVLNQAGNVFTYSLNKDININSVQIGANGPKITNDGNNIKIGDKDGNATKITNVAAGTGDTDAVNVSQLKAAQAAATTKVEEADGIKVVPTTNADGSTTYTVSAKTDGTTTKIDGNGNIAAVTTTFTPSTDGKVGAPVGNGDSLVTANTVADAINNSGWKLAADGTTGTELINPSDTVTFKTGSSNLTVKRDGANITYDLAKDININSVKFGDNGPTIKADASNNINIAKSDGSATKITNVAAGTGDTDAVNVSQLKAAQAAATTKVEEADGIKVVPTTNADGSTTYTVSAKTDGTTTKIDGNGNIAAVTTTFTPSTDGKVGAPVGNGDSLVTANTVADAINNSGWKATSGATGSGVVDGTTEELINPSETVTFQAGDNMVLNQAGNVFTYSLNKDININSVQFNDGPKITNDGDNIKVGDKDGNATKITNVKAGEADTDAVNVSQLEKAQAAATTKVEEADGIKVVPTTNADGSTTYTVSAKTDGTTTKIDGNGNIAAVTTTFTPSTDGKVGAPVGNGDSLVTANTVADAINNSGWKATSGATGSGVVDGTTEELINPSETVTFQAGDNMVLNQAGNVFTYSLNKDININSVQFNDGPKITNDGDNIKVGDKDGNATKITNVAAGTADTDAVNVSQLKEAADNLVTTGFNIADGKGGNDNVKLGETVTFADPAGNIITTVTDNKVEFGLNSTLSVGKAGEPGKVGIKGADGEDAISLNGKDGTIGLKGADGKDGISLNGKDGTIGINGKDGANATLTVEKASPALDGKDGQNGEDGQTRIVYTKPNGSKEEVATMNDGLNFKADDGSIVAKKLNETLDITGGADKDGLTDKNIGVNNKDGKLVVQLAKDINLTDAGSVTIGDTKLNNNSLTVGGANKVTVDGETGIIKGLTNTTWDPNATYTGGQAATQEQLKSAGDQLTTKGLNFNGNKGENIHKNLGDTLLVKGALANDAAASAKNVRVDSENGELIVKISENPVFTTVQTGETGDRSVLGKDGLTITNEGKDTVSLTEKGLDNGNNQIVNVASGLTKDGNKVELKDAEGSTLTNAVNVGDLKEAADNLVTTGFNIADGKGGNDNVKLGETVTFTDPAGNIITTVTDNKVEFGLNSTLSVGKAGEPGKVGIKGADGEDAISLNGKDGTIGLKGADGKDGISLNGKDGTIGINGKDGANATLTVEKASPALDGKDGQNGEDGQTRIVYTKPNGSKEEVATMNDGLNFKADDGSIVAKKLNETLDITGGADKDGLTDKNIGVNNKDGKLVVQLAKDINLTDAGSVTIGDTKLNNNSLTVGGANKVTVDGETGTIKGLTNTTWDPNATYTGGQAATQEQLKSAGDQLTTKGLNFAGNQGAEIHKDLGQTLAVKGALANDAAASAKNVRVDSENGELIVKVSENPVFTTVQAGKDGDRSVLSNDGLTITNEGKPTVSLTEKGLDNGNNQIVNVKSGINGVDGKPGKDGKPVTSVNDLTAEQLKEVGTNGANINDVRNATNNLVTTGFKIDADKRGNGLTDADTVELGQTVKYTGKDGNIVTTVTDNQIDFALNSTLSVGKAGEPGKVGIKGADGKDAISLNGKDGTIGLKGADGKDGISLNGKDGTIGINGKDGANATLTVEKASPALDGKDGQNGEDGQTRIVYTKPNGSKEEVATMNDGLKFGANAGTNHAAKLNSLVDIKGADANTDWSKFDQGANIMTNVTTDANGNGRITVGLAKDLKGIDSITVNNGPVINGNGIDMNGDKITNVKAGTEDNDAVNVSQLKAVEATANKGWNLTTNGKADSKSNVKPGDTVDFNNTDGNVKIENTGNKVTVNLNKDIDLTKDGSVTIGDTKVNNDGLTIVGGPSVTKSGINAGGKKITNVAPGEISATSKDAINGSQLYNVQKAAVAAKTEVKAGDNVQIKKATGTNGQDIYTVSAKDTSASVTAGSTAVAVTKGATTKVGTTDVTDYKVDLSQSAKDDIKKGVDAKDIVDNKGLTFAGDNGSTNVQKLGSTVNVKGDSNITTQASGNTVKVTLNPNVTVESVTATKSVNVGAGNAQVALTTNVGKDGVRELSVGSANAPTRITNVAPGVNGTDAVNVDQLKGVGQHINNRIDDVADDANAGVSSAMAMAALPQAYIPGKSMLTGGIASYNGEGAVAVGFSKLSDNGRWVMKMGGTADTQGNVGGAIGAGFHF